MRAARGTERACVDDEIGAGAHPPGPAHALNRATLPTTYEAHTPTPHLGPQINFLSLLAANPRIANPDRIFSGLKVNLPCPPKIMCRAAVSVQEGDTLMAISEEYGVTLQDLLDTNLHIVHPDLVYPGDVVYVPPCTQTPDSVSVSAVETARHNCWQRLYFTKKGDTPGTVAAMFNMKIGDVYHRYKYGLFPVGSRLRSVVGCPNAARLSWTSAQVCKSFYTVKHSDTPKTAAAKARTTIAKLMIGNPLSHQPRSRCRPSASGASCRAEPELAKPPCPSLAVGEMRAENCRPTPMSCNITMRFSDGGFGVTGAGAGGGGR